MRASPPKKRPVQRVTKKKGRPKAKLNLSRIKNQAAEFCSIDEIAASQGVAGRTILRAKDDPKVLEAIEVGKALGRSRLRSQLWKMAKKGNIAAVIFLAKQASILGYSDKTEMQHVGTGKDGAIAHAITVTFVRPVETEPVVPAPVESA